VSGQRWKVGDRVRLRRGAALYAALGAGSFVVVGLEGTMAVVQRYERRWFVRKLDLVRMGKAL